MTEIKKKRRRKVKIKDVIVKPQYKKSVKSGMTTVVKPDRITSNLSLEAFNGCWVGFGFESDVQPDETMEQAKERVWNEVVDTVYKRSQDIVNER